VLTVGSPEDAESGSLSFFVSTTPGTWNFRNKITGTVLGGEFGHDHVLYYSSTSPNASPTAVFISAPLAGASLGSTVYKWECCATGECDWKSGMCCTNPPCLQECSSGFYGVKCIPCACPAGATCADGISGDGSCCTGTLIASDLGNAVCNSGSWNNNGNYNITGASTISNANLVVNGSVNIGKNSTLTLVDSDLTIEGEFSMDNSSVLIIQTSRAYTLMKVASCANLSGKLLFTGDFSKYPTTTVNITSSCLLAMGTIKLNDTSNTCKEDQFTTHMIQSTLIIEVNGETCNKSFNPMVIAIIAAAAGAVILVVLLVVVDKVVKRGNEKLFLKGISRAPYTRIY